jgi:hypothetical protein
MFIINDITNLNNENSIDSFIKEILNFDIESSDKTLDTNLCNIFENLHPIIKSIIILSGTKYVDNNNYLYKILNIIIIIIQVCSILGSIYFGINIVISYAFLYNDTMGISGDNSFKTILINGILFGIIFGLQSIVLLPSFYYINKRLNKKINKNSNELLHYHIYSNSSIISNTYLLFTITISVIIPAKALIEINVNINVYYIIMEMTISLLMAVNLYLLIIDINISIEEIEKLKIILLSNTVEENDIINSYTTTKKGIKNQIKKTYWQITSILMICVLNIVYIVYNTYQIPYVSIYDEICENCFFIKEIPFMCIVMYYSAIINEKSDEITEILLYNKFVNKYDQLLTYNIAKSEGIKMEIFGYSLRRKEVIMNWVSFIITIIIGIIKNKIFS